MTNKYVITEGEWIRINNFSPDMAREIFNHPLTTELEKEHERTLNEFMNAIDYRFNDTQKGKMIITIIRDIKTSLNTNEKQNNDEYPNREGLQEFPFRSIPRIRSARGDTL